MIGIFDSGVGGFSLLKVLLNQHPNIPVRYVADQAYLPYGEKDLDTIRDRAETITSHLIESGCQIIVIACNTATVSTPIAGLRSAHPEVRFVGIEPPVKPLINSSEQSLLLVTPKTAKSTWLKQKIIQHQADRVKVQDCPGLAEAVEAADKETIHQLLNQVSTSMPGLDFNTIGLGCTHYSLIKSEIRHHFPGTKIYDPAEAVINQVSRIIKEISDFREIQTPEESLVIQTTATDNQLLEQRVFDLLTIKTQVESISI